ncbi:MAG: DUF4363 family protein [Firmicutes bacterium]|nr:DUF4363 family protein [Bacillota bacterium]
MRLLSVLTVLLVIMVLVGVWTNHTINITAEDFSQDIDQIVKAAETNNWDAAIKKTKALDKKWHSEASWWPVLLDHQEIDNIEFTLARVKEYITQKNTDLSLGHLSELKLMIQHIPEKEAVNLKNIL